MRTGTVYKITNTITGMSYIGQTIEKLSRRLQNHYHGRNTRPTKISKALQEYDLSCFTIEALEENVPVENLLALESLYIKIFDTVNVGYNMTEFGSGHNKGKNRSAETKAKISASNTGKKHSAESKAKMSAAAKGRKNSAETRAKLSAALTGRTFSDEHKAKISAALQGRTLSAEHKAKLSAAAKARGSKV